ncbi:MAG: hypothetical protein AAF250_01855 [Pseudomonadota bacterium]
MTRLPDQFLEDRALRNAARDVFMADIAHARASFSGKGIAARIGSQIGDGAKDVIEVARSNADDNRGVLAALIGAILVFFAREPILEVLGLVEAESDQDMHETTEQTVGLGPSDDPIPEYTDLTPYVAPQSEAAGDNDER